jgi:hypothetical protein
MLVVTALHHVITYSSSFALPSLKGVFRSAGNQEGGGVAKKSWKKFSEIN